MLLAVEIDPQAWIGAAASLGGVGFLFAVTRFERRGYRAMLADAEKRVGQAEDRAEKAERRAARAEHRVDESLRLMARSGIDVPDSMYRNGRLDEEDPG